MKMTKSRREFIKKTMATAAMIPAMGATSSLFSKPLDKDNVEQFSNEELLQEFDIWVESYISEINKEKKLGREFKDNEALAQLPNKMEELMPLFKSRFSDPQFLKDYLKISIKLTEAIDVQF